jgi:hypothetical protein
MREASLLVSRQARPCVWLRVSEYDILLVGLDCNWRDNRARAVLEEKLKCSVDITIGGFQGLYTATQT